MDSITEARTNGTHPEPVAGDRGAPIRGPRNPAVEAANPDLLSGPPTDYGTVPNLKFPYAQARNRVMTGGWGREITTRELPASKELAGVNMALTEGGVRELHWHKEAEWAFMIAGRARSSGLDEEGRNFLEDVGEGDLWYFPAGIPHHIQGLEGGCEFLLVFDDGDFSENETFLVSDWFAHTPPDVLAKNFGVPASAFGGLPQDLDHSRWIFETEVPPALEQDRVTGRLGRSPHQFAYRTYWQEPIRTSGGQVRIVDSSRFAVSKTVAMALVEVEPGAMREMHWHPNASEWQYYLQGTGRMTVFAASHKARTFDYQAGDVGYVPYAMGHYVENTGDEPLRFLEMFKSELFADVSLTQWLGSLSPALVRAHLGVGDDVIAALPETKPIVTR